MNLANIGIPLLVLLSIPAIPAHAQVAMTREQVKAELRQAIRSGDMPADGDTGLKLNQLYPHRYPAPAATQGVSRASVKADLVEAMRTGDVVAVGDGGLKLNEISPGRYPAPVVLPGKTRDEVKAETAEAIRTGDIVLAGESGLKLNEQYPQRYAKQASAYAAARPDRRETMP